MLSPIIVSWLESNNFASGEIVDNDMKCQIKHFACCCMPLDVYDDYKIVLKQLSIAKTDTNWTIFTDDKGDYYTFSYEHAKDCPEYVIMVQSIWPNEEETFGKLFYDIHLSIKKNGEVVNTMATIDTQKYVNWLSRHNIRTIHLDEHKIFRCCKNVYSKQFEYRSQDKQFNVKKVFPIETLSKPKPQSNQLMSLFRFKEFDVGHLLAFARCEQIGTVVYTTCLFVDYTNNIVYESKTNEHSHYRLSQRGILLKSIESLIIQELPICHFSDLNTLKLCFSCSKPHFVSLRYYSTGYGSELYSMGVVDNCLSVCFSMSNEFYTLRKQIIN